MSAIRAIRLTAAIALLCATCLPLSQCSKTDAPRPPATSSLARTLFPRNNDQFGYEYAIGEIGFTSVGVLTLLAFTWPLLFATIAGRLHRARFLWIQHSTELLLCGGTIYWLHCLTFSGSWLYGAYVVILSVAVFGGTSLVLMLDATRTLLQQRRSGGR